MNREQLTKIISFVVLGILLLNLVLFALRMISTLIFWIIIGSGFMFVYMILPKLNKKK